MVKPIHMMVRVKDEARSVDFYRKAFGLEIAERVDFPDFTLIYMRAPTATSRSSSPSTRAAPSPTTSATATATSRSSPTIWRASARA